MPQTLDLTELNNVDPNVLNLPTSLISPPRNFVLIHIIHSQLQHYVTTTGEKKRERRKREIFFFFLHESGNYIRYLNYRARDYARRHF